MRRIVSVLLSLILAVTALSACGASNTKVDMTKVNSRRSPPRQARSTSMP